MFGRATAKGSGMATAKGWVWDGYAAEGGSRGGGGDSLEHFFSYLCWLELFIIAAADALRAIGSPSHRLRCLS